MKMHTWQIENGQVETNYDHHTTVTTTTTHFTPHLGRFFLFIIANGIYKMLKLFFETPFLNFISTHTSVHFAQTHLTNPVFLKLLFVCKNVLILI